MRIILRPGGLALIFVAFAILIGVAVSRRDTISSAGRGGKVAGVKYGGREPAPGVSAGNSIIVPTDTEWSLVTQPPAQAQKSLFVAEDVPGRPNSHALHLTVSAVDAGKYWSAQLLKSVPGNVKAGRSMQARFWGRSKTNIPVYVVFEEGNSPHAAELSKQITMTPEWKQYQLPFKTTKDHTEVRANFCLKAGIQPGELEVSDVHLDDLGPAG